MKAWKNPFEILHATPWDNRRRLASLETDAALLGSEETAKQARAALLDPHQRLYAELRWVGKKENALCALNRAVKAFEESKVKRMDAAQAADRLEALCDSFAKADAWTAARIINHARKAAGFRTVSEADVQDALNTYARELAQSAAQLLRPWERLGKVIVLLAQRALEPEKIALTNNGLLRELAAEYEIRIAAKMEQEREAISAQVERLVGEGRMRLDRETNKLCRHLTCWNDLVLPLRRLGAARALGHKPSIDCFLEAFKAMIALHDKLHIGKLSCQLAQTIKECFSDMEELQERLLKCDEISKKFYEFQKQTVQKNHKELIIGTIVCSVCLLLAILSGPEEWWKAAVGLLCLALGWVIQRWTKKKVE